MEGVEQLRAALSEVLQREVRPRAALALAADRLQVCGQALGACPMALVWIWEREARAARDAAQNGQWSDPAICEDQREDVVEPDRRRAAARPLAYAV